MGNSDVIVFFDGVCGLCNRTVDFLLARDRARRMKFAPLQGPTALARLGAEATQELSTVVLVIGTTVYRRSTAVLRAVAHLGGIWRFALALLIIPAPLRDAIYAWVARHRYRWFGKLDACRLPTRGERASFLD